MASPMSNKLKFEAITAIAVIDSRPPDIDVFQKLGATLAAASIDYEMVVVANNVPSQVAEQLRALADTVANVTIHFLAQYVDRDSAVLIGIDHALGDWVVVLTPTSEEVASLPQLLEKAGPYEVVFAGARGIKDIPIAYRTIARVYFRVYEHISGSHIDWPAPRVRIYSRAAARYLASLLDGEFAIRSLHFSGAFPGTRETITGLPLSDLELPNFWRALRKAARGLLNASTVPLRAVIGTALVGGSIAVTSSIYTILIYVMKDNVAPGWTTLSLQMSIMMLLFSVMFALIAEYVLKMYRTMTPRQRITVVREIRSPLRVQAERLNVIGSDGSFQLGAPREALPTSDPQSELTQ